MALYPSYILVTAFALAVASSGQACAGFLLEGDATSLTVVADQAPRNEIIAGIARRLSVESKGAAVPDGLVSGTFTGDLGHVLNAILPDNGFVIAYSDGQPVAVTFTGRSNKALQPVVRTPDEPVGNRPNMGAEAQTGLMPPQPAGASGDHTPPALGTANNRNNEPPVKAGAKAGSTPRTAAPFVAIDDPLHLVPTE